MGSPGVRLLDTFEMVQIINLESRPDRLREMKAELQKIGLPIGNPQIEVLQASRFEDKGEFESIGARGCFDSHLRALVRARETGAESVLILEDDCSFAAEIGQTLEPILSDLDRRAWAVFYGWNVASAQNNLSESLSSLALVDPMTPVMKAHFIAFNRMTFNPLIDYLQKMVVRPGGSPDGGPMHIDGAYGWFRAANPGLETWAANPDIAFQRSSRSDIRPLGTRDSWPIIRTIWAALRHVKNSTSRI